jgi:hypothetical protein
VKTPEGQLVLKINGGNRVPIPGVAPWWLWWLWWSLKSVEFVDVLSSGWGCWGIDGINGEIWYKYNILRYNGRNMSNKMMLMDRYHLVFSL